MLLINITLAEDHVKPNKYIICQGYTTLLLAKNI